MRVRDDSQAPLESIPTAALNQVQKLLDPHQLTTIQKQLIEHCWIGVTYQEIATVTGYEDNYVRAVGAQLWQALSQSLDIKVTKSNFRSVVQQHLTAVSSHPPDALEFPQGQVPLGSKAYIVRGDLESICNESVTKPGALIRIRAPKQMGKTSLMARILDFARQQDYATVTLNLELASTDVLNQNSDFLRWFCVIVGRALRLPNRLDDYWEPVCGSRSNCTEYFEAYLLPELSRPLVLALDNIDAVFNYPTIATELFGMLRAWYESARYGGPESEIWQQLRLVTVYSTEVYIPLDIHQSPFNVGLPIKLPPFTLEQVQDLVQRHQLNWTINDIEKLMNLVGGHPYLIRITLYHAKKQSLSMDEIVETALSTAGIYSNHLEKKFWAIQSCPKLLAAMTQLIIENDISLFTPVTRLKLSGMGLIDIQDNKITVICNLYRQYFQVMLSKKNT
ncbi:AAA-like domain-containing protein [Leptothoe kymatousa]|uniref:AAA-like domain-containing protein n=1 Tax=Leptothoe kymatousa TAU-MAC 1615 TaxID=2364775 RepID=A0ABS5Y775_9CYAN|nr:AAA-like domain-containing protein [Leptothoe kymatousa]MBT9313652.1 AAA-like domain-containing protein [Leptothoe kymatousa TAU-MAC 1615]